MAHPDATRFKMTLPSEIVQNASYYVFHKVGDEIPLHGHTFWHSCCCLKGKCEAFDDTGKTAIVNAGQYVDFKAGRLHGIRALEAGTMTMHISEPGAPQ